MGKNEFLESLEEIISDTLYIGNVIDDQYAEIKNNLWAVSCGNDLSLDTNDFMIFFERVIENRRKQIKEMKRDIGSLFYAWVDEQAGQIRFNVISDFGNELPFKCKIEIVDSLEYIIDDFLDSPYRNGIPLCELEPVDIKLQEEDSADDSIDSFILKVYCLNL